MKDDAKEMIKVAAGADHKLNFINSTFFFRGWTLYQSVSILIRFDTVFSPFYFINIKNIVCPSVCNVTIGDTSKNAWGIIGRCLGNLKGHPSFINKI